VSAAERGSAAAVAAQAAVALAVARPWKSRAKSKFASVFLEAEKMSSVNNNPIPHKQDRVGGSSDSSESWFGSTLFQRGGKGSTRQRGGGGCSCSCSCGGLVVETDE